MPRFLKHNVKPVKIISHKKIIYVTAVLLATVHFSCSRKSDSWTSRTFHQTTSQFNPYFNAEQSFIEGADAAYKSHVDDYDEILEVYRWTTESSATAIAPQMDRTLEKCAKVIRDHSMVIKGKQKNQYVIKSYLLIGKARFYKYDFFPSLETFNYIIQQFSKDKKAKDLVAEAQLWAGRCQIMIGNQSSAEAYFDELYGDKRISKKLKADISASMAQMHINTKNYESAITSLNEAITNGPKKQQRIRWTFIKAQVHERLGNNYEASQAYKEVILLKPSDYDMLFTAQLNRAKNFDVYMENANIVYRELNKMLEDEKNIEYQDQIYYVMAEVALAEEEFEKATDYLKKSVRKSIKNNIQKGLSYLKMADIDFSFKEYVRAQAYYDSASSTLPAVHKRFAYAKKRKESLTGLVNNIKIVQLEDSLQRVAKMTPEAQRKMYEDYIVWLQKEEERLKREKEIRELNAQLENESQNMAGTPINTGNTGWYFYNANSRASGISAFQSKWGSRKLEDNWRQKNKSSVNFDDGDDTPSQTNNPSEISSSGGKYDPDFYLAKVPNTEEMMDTSNARIMRAYVALGRIYKEELNDFKESSSSYSKVLERYPACKYEPRVLFSLYRLYVGEGKTESAEQYKTELVNKYPSSIYTKLLLNPGKLDKNDESYKAIALLYENTYKDYKKGNYKAVLKSLEINRSEYGNSLLEPKFALLEAMTLGKLKKEKEFIEGLQLVVAKYPNTQEAIMAQSILDLTDTENNENGDPGASSMGNYTYDSKAAHKFIAIVPNQGVNINDLRNSFADYNQEYFRLEKLQIQNIFLDKDRQLVIVSGFTNAAKAKVYYNGVLTNTILMGYLPAQITTKLIISDDNYKEFYREKNLNEYLNFLKAKYQIEEST